MTGWTKSEQDEISRISEYIDRPERVLAVATQRRWFPGGSPVTPDTIFATDRKIIIRNPMLLGLREHVDYWYYEDITNIKHKKGCFTSSLLLTSPGMGTAARGNFNGDGIINAIPTPKALEIARMVRSRLDDSSSSSSSSSNCSSSSNSSSNRSSSSKKRQS